MKGKFKIKPYYQKVIRKGSHALPNSSATIELDFKELYEIVEDIINEESLVVCWGSQL